MRNSTYNPIEKGIQSDLYEEARRQEEAYGLLRQGLARFDKTGGLLDPSALDAILPFQEKLVLSGREHWLLNQSQEVFHTQKKRRRTRIRLIVLMAFALLFLFFQSLRLLNTTDAEERIVEGAAAKPSVRAVQTSGPTSKQTSEEHPSPAKPSKLKTEKTPAPIAEGGEVLLLQEDKTREATATTPAEEAAPDDPKSKFSMVLPVHTREGEVWRVRKEGKWGLANPQGKVLLPLEFQRVRVLHEEQGYFILEDGRQQGVANAAGSLLLPAVYDDLGTYYEALALLVVIEKHRAGVFNLREGRVVVKPEFQTIAHFSEGLFGAQSTNGKWGFVDVNGQVIIPPAYDAIVEPFRDGRALVTLEDTMHYINRKGEVLAPLR